MIADIGELTAEKFQEKRSRVFGDDISQSDDNRVRGSAAPTMSSSSSSSSRAAHSKDADDDDDEREPMDEGNAQSVLFTPGKSSEETSTSQPTLELGEKMEDHPLIKALKLEFKTLVSSKGSMADLDKLLLNPVIGEPAFFYSASLFLVRSISSWLLKEIEERARGVPLILIFFVLIIFSSTKRAHSRMCHMLPTGPSSSQPICAGHQHAPPPPPPHAPSLTIPPPLEPRRAPLQPPHSTSINQDHDHTKR